MPVDVVGLGTCNIDFINKVPRLVGIDDEVNVEKLVLSVGGSASNFTVGLSRLNISTGIVARIGNDYFGQLCAKKLRDECVETQRLIPIDGPTGMVFIAVDPPGERSMYSFMGANAEFTLLKEDIDYIQSSKVLHITGMYKEVFEEASRYANFLSLNPGTLLSAYGIDELYKPIKRANVIFLNKKEVKIITGENLDTGAQTLLDTGVKMVVVTCGKDGARLYTKDKIIHSPVKETAALDTTGAGDSFAAGFIAAYIKDKELKECLDFANIVASSCVGKIGAMNVSRACDLNI
ncbi:carbohydrate kinase family protein [Methanobacterium sp.]|uniref:carbohydrate kinase family protein n=1 Tax=Methanobacterium sp. TaxID=2164 RepID=UPI003C70A28C